MDFKQPKEIVGVVPQEKRLKDEGAQDAWELLKGDGIGLQQEAVST